MKLKHPVKKIELKCILKKDISGNPILLKFEDGYKIQDSSYIEDLLIEKNLIKESQRTEKWK